MTACARNNQTKPKSNNRACASSSPGPHSRSIIMCGIVGAGGATGRGRIFCWKALKRLEYRGLRFRRSGHYSMVAGELDPHPPPGQSAGAGRCRTHRPHAGRHRHCPHPLGPPTVNPRKPTRPPARLRRHCRGAQRHYRKPRSAAPPTAGAGLCVHLPDRHRSDRPSG